MGLVGMFGFGRVHEAMPRANKGEKDGEPKGNSKVEGKGGYNRAGLDLRRLAIWTGPRGKTGAVGADQGGMGLLLSW